MNNKVARRIMLLSALVISTQVAVRTEAAPTRIDQPSTNHAPDAGNWVLLIAGFGLVGLGVRRRGIGSTYY